MANLFKGRGNIAVCDNSRGVLVSDASSKHVHSWCRSLTMPHFQPYSRCTQFGGVPKLGADMCGHGVRTFWSYAKQHGMSAACRFIDAIGAFDSVIRD